MPNGGTVIGLPPSGAQPVGRKLADKAHFVAGADDCVCDGRHAVRVRDEPDKRCDGFGVRVVVNAMTCGTENQADLGPAEVGQRRDGPWREGRALTDLDLCRQRFNQSIQHSVARFVVHHATSVWRRR